VSRLDVARLVRRYKDLGSFIYSAKLALRYVADRLRFSRGTHLVMGNALAARLFHALRGQGVEVAFQSSVKTLVSSTGGSRAR